MDGKYITRPSTGDKLITSCRHYTYNSKRTSALALYVKIENCHVMSNLWFEMEHAKRKSNSMKLH